VPFREAPSLYDNYRRVPIVECELIGYNIILKLSYTNYVEDEPYAVWEIARTVLRRG
jgi:hypothetical protein